MPQSKYLIVFLFFFSPGDVHCQDITGLWKGQLYNDSTQKYYSYEIGISEEKGKLSGFSHTWFLLDDKQYFGVKKVKVRKAPDGKIVVEDDGLISHNYPVAPAKGVKQLNILTLDAGDSIMRLTGPFTTNRTKDYAPLTGTVSLERKNDYWQSALIPHLQELKVEKLSFVKPVPAAAEIVIAIPGDPKERQSTISKVEQIEPLIAKQEGSIDDRVDIDSIKLITANTVHEKRPASNTEKKQGIKKPQVISISQPAIAATVAESKIAAANVSGRATILQQTVFFNSDSLQISLYDNGEVDGDTVSVLMNGEIIIARERMSTNAVRKTIQVPPGSDSILLVMYAENLGAIAPNTGLLVVRDGKSIYEVRFSGDLQKNAAVMLRRKR